MATAVLFTLALAPALWNASDDLGLAGVLSTDEELAGRVVRYMLDTGRPSTNGFFSYGALHFDLAFALLLPFELTTGVSDRAILITLRAIALVAGCATMLLTAALARRLGGWIAAGIAAVGVAVTPEMVGWSVTAHPDTLQLALLAATLLAACMLTERCSTRLLLAAGVLAGLTFATKYLGVLLLPLVLLAASTGRTRQPRGGTWLRALVADSVTLALGFAAAFVLTNPYALAEPSSFMGQVRRELAHTSQGHVFVEANGGWRWLVTTASPPLGGPLLPVLGFAAGAWALARTARGTRGIRELFTRIDTATVLTLWLALYTTVLVARTGYGAPRYALPLLPATVALGSAALVALITRLCTRVRVPASYTLGAAALVLVLALPLARTIERAAARQDRVAGLDSDPRVLAGRWLDEQAPVEALILHDAYLYLPPRRARAPVTFGLTRSDVARLRPHYIIVNEDIRGRFRWEIGAERYVDGPAAYTERMDAYAALEAGGLCGYMLLRDFGTVKVYASPPDRDQGC